MLFPHTLEAKKMETHMHTILGKHCWCELFDFKNPNTKFVSQQRVEKASHINTILNKLEIQKMLHTMQNWVSICKYKQKNCCNICCNFNIMSTKRNMEEKYMEKDKKKGIKKTIEEKEEVGKRDFIS